MDPPTFHGQEKGWDPLELFMIIERAINEIYGYGCHPTPPQSLPSWKELRGKALFSKFDIRAGYNNIQIRTEDTYKRDSKPTKDFTNGS